jgi:hypothetical protein
VRNLSTIADGGVLSQRWRYARWTQKLRCNGVARKSRHVKLKCDTTEMQVVDADHGSRFAGAVDGSQRKERSGAEAFGVAREADAVDSNWTHEGNWKPFARNKNRGFFNGRNDAELSYPWRRAKDPISNPQTSRGGQFF